MLTAVGMHFCFSQQPKESLYTFMCVLKDNIMDKFKAQKSNMCK